MRIYLPLSLADVESLAAGGSVTTATFLPASDDEADEFTAFNAAAAAGDGVIAADVTTPNDAVALDAVASFHVAVDDTGDLAWYAVEEIDAVLELLRNATANS